MLQRVIGHGIAQALMDQKLCKTYKYLFTYVPIFLDILFMGLIICSHYIDRKKDLTLKYCLKSKNVSEMGWNISFKALVN